MIWMANSKLSLVIIFFLYLVSSCGGGSSSTTGATVQAAYDFNEFNGSGFSPSPAVGQLDSDVWAISGLSDGTLDFGGTAETGDFARGLSTGNVTTGGIYAFDVGSLNVILGTQPSAGDFGTAGGTITLREQNTTGSTLSVVSITYTHWFLNNASRSTNVSLSYSADGINFTTDLDAEIATPEIADSTPAWTSLTFTNGYNVSIPNNDYIYFRWTIIDEIGAGSRDEVGVDNITIEF